MSELESPDQMPVEEQEPELSHSDKLVGIFSEPGKTFESIARFPIKTIDWVLPVMAMLVVVIISQFIMAGNPQIKAEMKQKQMEAKEKWFQDKVDKGTMTKEQADEQLQTAEEQMDKMSGTIGKVFTAIGILVIGFITYLVIAGFYFLFVKFIFKADGTYKHVLLTTGLTSYISIISVIFATIFALVSDKLVRDVSAASLFSMDTKTFTGFLLAKVDIFSIWVYFVIALGMTKLFNAGDSKKYYYFIFGAWIIWSLLVFVLIKYVPILQNFA
ncbi:MAG: YIP1 family protein [Ignavibacteriaceae bacterium]|nr:YIP1 family protein [Ignavibacteriaceae bacterium]